LKLKIRFAERPVEVEAEDGHPGELGESGEVEEVAERGARRWTQNKCELRSLDSANRRVVQHNQNGGRENNCKYA
jgi:hypothetical protein